MAAVRISQHLMKPYVWSLIFPAHIEWFSAATQLCVMSLWGIRSVTHPTPILDKCLLVGFFGLVWFFVFLIQVQELGGKIWWLSEYHQHISKDTVCTQCRVKPVRWWQTDSDHRDSPHQNSWSQALGYRLRNAYNSVFLLLIIFFYFFFSKHLNYMFGSPKSILLGKETTPF